MADDCEKKAADLAFDVTKQFLTLGLAGIAFVVGLSFSTPGVISRVMLWGTVGVFGLSAIFGLLFLMSGVSQLQIEKTYDVYTRWLRALSIVQIALVLAGVILLLPLVNRSSFRASGSAGAAPGTVEVTNGTAVVYKTEPGKTVTVEVENGKVRITSSK
jgi:hypothetical protein